MAVAKYRYIFFIVGLVLAIVFLALQTQLWERIPLVLALALVVGILAGWLITRSPKK